MKINLRLAAALALVAALVALPTFAADFATFTVAGDSIVVAPNSGALALQLTVSGPNGAVVSQRFAAGEQPSFRALDEFGQSLGDGSYTIELVVIPAARDRGDANVALDRQIQTFYATMIGGAFVSPSGEEVMTRDQVILDDLIVDGSACIGFDCVNGESFGFDTIRIKENNLRIKAQDTSSSASFPSNDWQITFNDSSNGGANKFSIDDVDGGRTPFTIEAGAPSHSLYVEDGGRVGFGTSTPVVDLHVKSGNTPTLRLEQDGTSGFTPQTWDVAGNEAGFFVRDATSGSTLPFRIRPGAPSSAIDIAAGGNVGIGDTSPDAPLEIQRTNDTAQLLVTDTGTGAQDLVFITNAGPSRFAIENTNGGTNSIWRFNHANDGVLRVSNSSDTDVELNLDQAGNLTILGGLITGTAGSCNVGMECDGVFHPDFEVDSIEEHSAQMWSNSYLPAVGPTRADVPVNLTQKTLGMLNELEKAHIYIEQLNDDLKTKDQELDELRARMSALEQALGLGTTER